MDFVPILSEISGEWVSKMATVWRSCIFALSRSRSWEVQISCWVPFFNHDKELQVDPFLDFVPILNDNSMEWRSKMATVWRNFIFAVSRSRSWEVQIKCLCHFLTMTESGGYTHSWILYQYWVRFQGNGV
jgi:hypothetical protein